MAKLNSGDKKASKPTQKIDLLNAKEFLFEIDGRTVNVEDASDAEFDRFIRLHIEMGWSLEDRVDAVNLALEKGKTLGVMAADSSAEKSKGDLIFSGAETALEGK